jgi:signal transduction histidine kinase
METASERTGRLAHFRHPFWPVTLITGAAAFVAVVVLLALFGQSGLGQYLALAGLAGAIFLVHGLSWWSAYTKENYRLGIWLIAGVEIVCTVLVPFFLADYWLIGFIQLASVPLAVGIADQPRSIPRAAVYALLGAAGMLAVDLLFTGPRLDILSVQPALALGGVILLVLQFVTLTFLLWYWRLRRGAAFRVRVDLATQQSLVLTGISAASIIIVTSVLITQIRTTLIEQVGQNFQTLAEINAERVGNRLEQQVDDLLGLGRQNTRIQEGLTTANEDYPESRDEVEQLLAEREQTWQTSPEASGYILQYRSNPQTIELSKFSGATFLHRNMLLTDRYGGLVAAQGVKPANYGFSDNEWWQTAWNNGQGGVFVGDALLTSDDGDQASLLIAVGVLNPQTNQTIGVLASTYNLRAIQRDVDRAQSQVSGELLLLAEDGRVIAGPDESLVGQPGRSTSLAQAIAELAGAKALLGAEPVLTESGWFLGADRQNDPAVLAFAPLNTTSGVKVDTLQGLNWQFVASDTQANALASVTRSMKVAGLVGVLVMVLVVVAAPSVARIVTSPIGSLTETAAAISEGDLERQAERVGPVELVTLAEAFNTLTGRLRSLINSLQEQVAQRTVELEARAEQLTTLNRITQNVASAHDLQTALEVVAEEMVRLFDVDSTGIALMNEDRSRLTVAADHQRVAGAPSTVGTVYPVIDNLSTTEVIESGQTVVVNAEDSGAIADPVRELLRGQGTESVMIVPLMARGEVIGTIGVPTRDSKRSFTAAEVELAETIAGQIAGAIDRARLFSGMQEAKEAAEEANEAKSSFLAGVSHELRTPLTSVLGFAKIVQRRLDERIFPLVQSDDRKTQRTMEQISKNLDIVVSEGERLTQLINNVLDLAKIEAGKIEWRMEQLAISEVVERAAATTMPLFEQRENLALITDVPDALPELIGDRDRLIQVVINLISNAVKFTEEGLVTCRVEAVDNDVIVRVIDTGIGISEADLGRVFEQFTQVGDTLTSKPSGTGLGLPISKEIIEHHGGRIWVESEPGKGSTFAFALPIPEQQTKSGEGVTSLNPATTGRGG